MVGNGYDMTIKAVGTCGVVWYDMIGYDGMLSPSKTQVVCTAGGRSGNMAHSGGTLASTWWWYIVHIVVVHGDT